MSEVGDENDRQDRTHHQHRGRPAPLDHRRSRCAHPAGGIHDPAARVSQSRCQRSEPSLCHVGVAEPPVPAVPRGRRGLQARRLNRPALRLGLADAAVWRASRWAAGGRRPQPDGSLCGRRPWPRMAGASLGSRPRAPRRVTLMAAAALASRTASRTGSASTRPTASGLAWVISAQVGPLRGLMPISSCAVMCTVSHHDMTGIS
jgi:hypothetical protein